MAKHQYAYQGTDVNVARAVGKSLPISTKQSIEICAIIRRRPVSYARTILQDAIDMKIPIPFKRYVNGYGHKPGMGPGRYAPTTAKGIMKTINAAVKNAEAKNLGADLIIIHAMANHASRSFRYGRQSRVKEKSTHLEIVVAPRPVKSSASHQVSSSKTKSMQAAKPQKTGAA